MDLQALNRAERQATVDVTALQEAVQRLESDKHTLTRSAAELRKQLEEALQGQSALRQTLVSTQASEESLKTLNLLLESQLRSAKAECAAYKTEANELSVSKRNVELELLAAKESALRAKREVLEGELREKELKIEVEVLRSAQDTAAREAELRREEAAAKAAALRLEFKQLERTLKVQIDTLTGELAAATAERDQRQVIIANLTERCDELAEQAASAEEENKAAEQKWADLLAEKNTEISELKDRNSVLPLLNFPTENREQVAFLMEKLTDLQVKYARASAKADTFEKQLRLLVEEVEAKAPVLAKQKTNYEEICEAYATLRASVELVPQQDQHSELSTIRQKFESETKDNDYLRQVVSTLSLQVRTLLIEVHRLRYGGDSVTPPAGTFRTLEELQKENERLRSDLHQAEAKQKDAQEGLLEAARVELVAQRETISQLTRQIQLSEDLLAQGYIPVTKMNQSTAERLAKENQMRLKVEALERDLDFEKEKVKGLETSAKTHQSESVAVRKELQAAKKSATTHQTKIAQLTTDLEDSRATIKRLQEDLATVHKSLASTRDLHEQLKLENARLREQYEVGAASEHSMINRIQEMQTAHRAEVDKFIAERETIYSQWRAREQELADTKKRWRDEVSRLKADIENLKAQLVCGQALGVLEDSPEVFQYRLQIAELKAALLDLNEAHKDLLGKYEELSQEHANMSEELRRLSDRYQLYRLKERCAMLQEDIDARTAMHHETLFVYRELQVKYERHVIHIQHSDNRIAELEDALAREKALYLQEVAHTSQLHQAAMEQQSQMERINAELAKTSLERDTLTAEANQRQLEWAEAERLSSGNFQYIREFQTQLSQLRREKVDVEVKYKELSDFIETERQRLYTEKREAEVRAGQEIASLEEVIEAMRGEMNQLRETAANSGKGLDPPARKALGRLVELHHRLLRLKS